MNPSSACEARAASADTVQRRVLYVDMAYTLGTVRLKGHENFFETRHSNGFFSKVWGVHPLADVAGSGASEVRHYDFSPRQVVIEGVSRSRQLPRLLYPLDFLITQLALIRQVAHLVRKENIDVIVATDPIYSGLFGWAIKRLTKRPLVVGVYANYQFAYQTFKTLAMPRLIPSYYLQSLVSRFVLARADRVIGGSRNYLDWALDQGVQKSKGAVIPIARNIQGCHLQPPSARAPAQALLNQLNVPVEGRYMIMVSRLIPVKYAEDGVRAMIHAAKADPRALGIVAGNGHLQGKLQQMVDGAGLTGRIIFVGHLSQEQLSQILPICVTISPLTGMALIEAGLGGSPIVAYAADWQAEFIEHGVNGYLVPLGDHAALGQYTAELLVDESERRRMAIAVRKRAESFSDRDTIAVTERKVFSALLGDRATT